MFKLLAEAQPSWYVMVTIVGGAVSITLTVVSFYLKGIKDAVNAISERADKQDEKIAALTRTQAETQLQFARCKNDCDRNFITAEQFVRSETQTRSLLEKLTQQVAELAGSLKMIEKLPDICGNIARQVVEAMNKETR